jgi:hypothetical protein
MCGKPFIHLLFASIHLYLTVLFYLTTLPTYLALI